MEKINPLATNRKNHKKGRKLKQKQTSGNRFSLSALTSQLKGSTSILKFVLAFVLFIVLFYVVYSTSFFTDYILTPFIQFQASLTGIVLNLFNQGATVTGGVVENAAGSINVSKGCDGIEPIAFFIIGVMIIPVALRSKLIGVFFGVLTLFILNILRIIGLFFANIYARNIFEGLHLHGGFALFIFITLIVWLIWADWAIKKYQ